MALKPVQSFPAAVGRRDIYVTTFAFTFMMGMGAPLVPQFLESLGATALVVGAVIGTYGILQIFVRLPIGNLSDVHGRRWTLRAAFAAAIAAGLFFVTAPSPAWVVPGQILFGFTAGAFWVSANAYVKDLADAEGGGPEITNRAMNHYAASISAGLLVGPPMGVVADLFGFRAGLTVFVWMGIFGLASTFLLEPLGRGDQERLPILRTYTRAWELLAIPDLRISLALTFCYSMLLGLASAFYPFYLRQVGFTAFLVGVLYAVRQAANTTSNLSLARLGRDEDPLGDLLVGIAVTALALALTPLFATFLPLLVLALVAGGGFALMIPSNLSLIAAASPEKETGLAMGIYGTGLGAGQLISPVLFGAVGEAYGLPWTFFCAGLVVLVLGVISGAWATRVDRTPPEGVEVVGEGVV